MHVPKRKIIINKAKLRDLRVITGHGDLSQYPNAIITVWSVTTFYFISFICEVPQLSAVSAHFAAAPSRIGQADITQHLFQLSNFSNYRTYVKNAGINLVIRVVGYRSTEISFLIVHTALVSSP